MDGFKKPQRFVVKAAGDRKPFMTSAISVSDPAATKTSGFYSAIDGKLAVSMNELIDVCERSITKFYMINFAGDKYHRFIAKCKQNNAKVTSVFNGMLVVAWRLVYKHFLTAGDIGAESTSSLPINYATLVNMRSFVKNVEMEALVWFCTKLYSSYAGELDIDADETNFWRTKFWQLARQESETLHQRLSKGEQFRMWESSKPVGQDESGIHYGMSNVIIPPQLTNEFKLFKIQEIYTFTSYSKDWLAFFSFDHFSICWLQNRYIICVCVLTGHTICHTTT